VIIPQSNYVNLMLSEAVKTAVSAGQFSIYAVSCVDQAITILMRQEAGTLSARGRYPKKSVHDLAISRLYAIASVVNGTAED